MSVCRKGSSPQVRVKGSSKKSGRQFQEKWLQEYDWLSFDEERQVMWCGVCREQRGLADLHSAFVKGTANFNHPAFDKHQRSEPHRRCLNTRAFELCQRQCGSSADSRQPCWDMHRQSQKQSAMQLQMSGFNKKKVLSSTNLPATITSAEQPEDGNHFEMTTEDGTSQERPASSAQLLQVQWKEHGHCLNEMFSELLAREHFVDVTLSCEGKSLKCHKMVLSACSSYFQQILTENPCPHPIVFLKDMKAWEVEALLEFMYKGQVSIPQEKLHALIKAAEALKVRGLAVSKEGVDSAASEPTQSTVSATKSCKRKREAKDVADVPKKHTKATGLSPSSLSESNPPKSKDTCTAVDEADTSENCEVVIVKLEPAETESISEDEQLLQELEDNTWMDEIQEEHEQELDEKIEEKYHMRILPENEEEEISLNRTKKSDKLHVTTIQICSPNC